MVFETIPFLLIQNYLKFTDLQSGNIIPAIMRNIILASASPRRKALLEQIGLKFQVHPSNNNETVIEGAEPKTIAQNIALEKARTVATNYADAIIIAADTFAIMDDRIIGKPHTPNEAYNILAILNGKTHSVITGFCIIDSKTGKIIIDSVETRVTMQHMTCDEIKAYIASGEPMDKAGGYAIQGLGASIITRIEGDYYNVVGLPLHSIVQALKTFDIIIP
jgi:septum formation protein